MTKYRDFLAENLDPKVGSVVGCGLDLVSRPVNSQDIGMALDFYRNNREIIDNLPIETQKQAIQEYIESGGDTPSCFR